MYYLYYIMRAFLVQYFKWIVVKLCPWFGAFRDSRSGQHITRRLKRKERE